MLKLSCSFSTNKFSIIALHHDKVGTNDSLAEILTGILFRIKLKLIKRELKHLCLE